MINEQTNEFYVTLLSNAGTLTYDNKLSEFHNDLPSTCLFEACDNWMVCLKSVGFSTSFFNVISPANEKSNKRLPSIVFNRVQDEELTIPGNQDKATSFKRWPIPWLCFHLFSFFSHYKY